MGGQQDPERMISEDEIALYDRQIRLWGLNAQEKIRGANVLVIRARALAQEIAKNLVLAGIGALTLLDPAAVTEEDLGAQFLLAEPVSSAERPAVGRNRAEVACESLRCLNPRVRITADSDSVSTKDAAYFQPFDVVIATDMDGEGSAVEAINAATRQYGRALYVASVHGMFGAIICDLIEHVFVVRRAMGNVSTSRGSETRTRCTIDVVEGHDGNGPVENVTKRELYSPWRAARTAGLPDDFTTSKRRLRRVSPALPCMRALWEFVPAMGGRMPRICDDDDDGDDARRFGELAAEVHAALGLPSETLTPKFVQCFLRNIGREVSPVAAILGGQLAQDVINVLGQTQQPIQNTVVLDGDSMESFVYALHPAGQLGKSSEYQLWNNR